MPKQTTLLDEEPMIAQAAESEIVDAELVEETANLPAVQATNPLTLIDKAIENKLDTQTLRELMELQERWEANQARKAYSVAMSDAQAEMGPVVRTKLNSQTNSKYAPHEIIDAAIKPIYTKHGFSLSFGYSQGAPTGFYRMFCDCRHRGGHVERIEADFPTDDSGIKGTVNKTPIQAMVSTSTYAKRSLTVLVFNVAINDDNDGNGEPDTIGPGQQQTIKDEIGRFPPDLQKRELENVLKFGECETLEKFPISKFQALMTGLKKGADKFHS